jgi:hypothetical protein
MIENDETKYHNLWPTSYMPTTLMLSSPASIKIEFETIVLQRRVIMSAHGNLLYERKG